MITSEYCTTMAAYNSWMNAKLYALCSSFPDAERKKDCGAFFGSIHNTLNHILSCDLMFLAGFTRGAAFKESDGDDRADFSELRQDRQAVDSQIERWASSVAQDWLDSPSSYAHHQDGIVRTVTKSFWVVHMFNHQTHHRGQVTTLLAQMGHDIGSTDLHMSVPKPTAAA